MKILFIYLRSIHSNASSTIRNIGFIVGAYKLGNQIDLISIKEDNTGNNYDDSIDVEPYLNKIINIEEPEIHKLLKTKKSITSSSKGKKKRSLNIKRSLRGWARKWYNFLLVSKAKKIELSSDYDLIISSSDPFESHVLARKIKKQNLKNIPWIQYWGDPLSDDINNSKNFKAKRLKESRILSGASSIMYTSPITLERQKKLFPQYSTKMHYINQSCLYSTRDSHVVNEIPAIGYFGDYHSRSRNIVPLINTISKDNRLSLVVMGDGDISSLKYGDNIHIYDRQNYSIVHGKEKEVDILVGVCNRKGGQIPAKIYYMAGSNKPVIVIVDGEYSEVLKNYFNGFDRYIICYNTEEEIQNAINTALIEIQSGKQYDIPQKLLPETVSKFIIESIQKEK